MPPEVVLPGVPAERPERTVERSFLFARSRNNSVTLDGANSDSNSGGQTRRNFDVRSFVSERTDTEISRRYDIDEREIGAGGYGKVYVAKDRMFKDRLVAIKRLVSHDEEKAQALKREVEIMKTLDHPSICKLFETYIQGKLMFFVIEHLEGGDLCDRIMEDTCIDEPTAAYIIRQASGALRYAHSHGIAHRDMKPENVCFCSSDAGHNRVKVIDWGLGRHFEHIRMKSRVGSVCFTAPEVMDPPDEDLGYTSACDLWSLGVMAYVTVSGKPPFYGGPIRIHKCMQEERYPLTGTVWDGISEDCKDFIARLLKFNPEERLPANAVLTHPWLARQFVDVAPDVVYRVLENVEQFSHAPDFLSICVASVARQLDHRSLDNIYRVFCRLDTNSDGVLDAQEVRAGFAEVFGLESDEFAEVDDMFTRLDLDGSGKITYTEFCAAGIGESSYTQEHVLWAAFRTFDIHDDGLITQEGMQKVLSNADVNKVWSTGVCEEVAQQVMDRFGDKDGNIHFDEWLSLMRECASQHCEETPKRRSARESSGGPEFVMASNLFRSMPVQTGAEESPRRRSVRENSGGAELVTASSVFSSGPSHERAEASGSSGHSFTRADADADAAP